MKSASTLIHPPALRPGDRVHIISPSGPVTQQNLAFGLNLLRSWDLELVVDDSVFARRPPFDYLAGTDEARLQGFLNAWNDPACNALFCSRGGYGAMRLLQKLPLQDLVERPRLLVGFSDITALHLYLAGKAGVATLHGPVVKSLSLHNDDPQKTWDHLHEALFAASDAPAPWTGLRCIRPGIVRAPLFGGNLSLILAMLATDYCPPLDGAILLIEEIGEVDYRLDRMLTALRLAVGDRLGALVLGEFSDCTGVYVDDEGFNEFLTRLAAEFSCPVVADAPFGHGSTNRPFPVGLPATLDAANGTLHFESHAARRT